ARWLCKPYWKYQKSKGNFPYKHLLPEINNARIGTGVPGSSEYTTAHFNFLAALRKQGDGWNNIANKFNQRFGTFKGNSNQPHDRHTIKAIWNCKIKKEGLPCANPDLQAEIGEALELTAYACCSAWTTSGDQTKKKALRCFISKFCAELRAQNNGQALRLEDGSVDPRAGEKVLRAGGQAWKAKSKAEQDAYIKAFVASGKDKLEPQEFRQQHTCDAPADKLINKFVDLYA
ncbi:hypothetical protein Rhopal_007312-T1, partial [Rhodotorula paludigena]